MTPEKPLPAWKTASRERLCTAILDAARVTFGEKGYDGATVEEIAARAEVGKGTVYNYFDGGKPALFAAVLRRHFGELQQLALEALVDDGTLFRARLERFVRAFLAYFDAHRFLLRMHLRDVTWMLLADDDGERCASLRAQRQALVALLVPPLEAAMGRGEVRRMPVATAAHLVFGTLLAYLFHTRAAGGAEAPPPDEAAALLVHLMLDGLTPRP